MANDLFYYRFEEACKRYVHTYNQIMQMPCALDNKKKVIAANRLSRKKRLRNHNHKES